MRKVVQRRHYLRGALVPGLVLGLVVGLLVCLPLTSADEDGPGADAPLPARIDFATHIEPVIRDRCLVCHGAAGPSAGLSLHSRRAALRRGNSGGRIIAGPLEENTLWERISSPDPDFRMPKGGELTKRELALFKRWIEQGSPWPEPGALGSTEDSGFPTLLDAGDMVLQQHPYMLIALLVILLLATRSRRMREAGHPFATGKGKLVVALLGHIRLSHVLIVAIGLTLVTALETTRTAIGAQEALRTRLESVHVGNPVFTYFFGDPPTPFRHPVPKTVDATYWRGNCERGPHLFNGGKYRTCTIHMSLCDAARNAVGVGAAVPADGLYLRLDIKRSPNTADTMYAEHQMSRVFISPTWYGKRIRQTKEPPILLEVLEPDWAWAGFVKISDGPGDGSVDGLLFVYQNLRTDGEPFAPKVHLGLTYDVVVEDGRVADGSDLWLGNLFWNTTMEPPPREYKLPLREWLHHEPIPEIPDGHEYHGRRNDR